MSHGDITAGEVFQDREMLNRLGYGIFDVTWTKDSVGFENVRDFSYVVAEDNDPKIYRRKVFDVLGKYYDNDLAKVLWNKFIDHKWVLSERAKQEVDLITAARDWFEKHGHAFLKQWTFQKNQVPERIRYSREPRKGVLGEMVGVIVPGMQELLNSGFSVVDILRAAVQAKKPLDKKEENSRPKKRARFYQIVPSFPHRRASGKHPLEDSGSTADQNWVDKNPYLVLQKINRKDQGRFYVRLVAELTGHEIRTPQEAEKRWAEILEHKWYMSERQGHDVGIRAAALDYYRRLNFLKEMESGQEE